MGVFNRRNAVTGWIVVKAGKWFVRRKAKRMQLNPLARRRAKKETKAARKEGKGGKR
jgi:hypothetical protein